MASASIRFVRKSNGMVTRAIVLGVDTGRARSIEPRRVKCGGGYRVLSHKSRAQ